MLDILPCENCGKEESYDCLLYLCQDKEGFLVTACIVYAIRHGLSILGRLDEDEIGE